MNRRERTGIAPALAVSVALHAAALAAVVFFGGLFQKPFQLGGGVPVTLVTSGPPEFIQAELSDQVQEAQTEAPDPAAEPEPAPLPTPAAAAVPKPDAKKPTPVTPGRTGPRAELDLDKLLSDVETTSKASTPPKKGGGKKGPKKDALTVQIGSGKRVSAATKGYLLNLGNDLSRRWNPNCLVEGGADVRAEVTFRVSFGGKLLGRPKSSEAGTKDPMVRVASERAIRAVYAAEPFNDFPPELYGEELIYPFDAPAACANR
jgi:periplasmic protein TonB